MKQLRQAGYTSDVLGNSGDSAGNLKPTGAAGAGMVWPVDFNYQMAALSSQKFAKAYSAEYGAQPLNYAAEAYDAAWFLAKPIKQAGRTDRAAIKDDKAVVAKEKFDTKVRAMADSGIGIRKVDQNAEAGLDVADDVVAIARGEVVFTGPATTARDNASVLRAFPPRGGACRPVGRLKRPLRAQARAQAK